MVVVMLVVVVVVVVVEWFDRYGGVSDDDCRQINYLIGGKHDEALYCAQPFCLTLGHCLMTRNGHSVQVRYGTTW